MAIDLELNTHSTGSDKVHVSETENTMDKQAASGANTASKANAVTISSFAHLDEKKLLRKMDLRLIPMLALLYLLAYLDRELSE